MSRQMSQKLCSKDPGEPVWARCLCSCMSLFICFVFTGHLLHAPCCVITEILLGTKAWERRIQTVKQIAGPVDVHTSCVFPQVQTSPGLGMDRYTVTPWSLAWGLHSGASNCRAVRPALSALHSGTSAS